MLCLQKHVVCAMINTDFIRKVESNMQLSSRTKGTCFLIFSAFSFAWMNAFVRLAGDLSFIQKSFFRNLIALLVALIMLFKERQPLHCDKKSAGALLLRATMGTVGIFCNFYAVDHLPISDASMLNKMSPFFSVLLAWLLLKERITWKQICIICGAFIGSLFIIKPTFSNLSLFPSCIGLLGGFGAGFAYTMVRYLGTRHVPKAWIIFLFSAFSCLVALPWLLLHYEPMTWKQLLSLIGAGLAAAGGQFGVTNAYFYAAPKDISVYDYTQIIFAALLGFFLFQQVPDRYSILGYCIIIGMAVCMFFYHKRAESHTA